MTYPRMNLKVHLVSVAKKELLFICLFLFS